MSKYGHVLVWVYVNVGMRNVYWHVWSTKVGYVIRAL